MAPFKFGNINKTYQTAKLKLYEIAGCITAHS